MSNDVSTDEAARLAKLAALTSLADGLDTTRLDLLILVRDAEAHLEPNAAEALAGTARAVKAAHDMVQGLIRLIPPPPPAPAGDEAAEGDA
jgi:hypothetical protein